MALIAGRARVRILNRSGTVTATLAATGISASHGAGIDTADLSFTAHRSDSGFTSASLLDDALAIVQFDDGAGYANIGTPYLLGPTRATIVADQEDAARTVQVTGKGVLAGLTAEKLVLHRHPDTVWRRGPRERYFGWQSPEFDYSGWPLADHYDRSPAPTAEKAGNPVGWVDGAADWINRASGAGGLQLMRGPSFTVTTEQKYMIRASADEEFRLYLNGHPIMNESDQETGYTHYAQWAEVLPAGTYYPAAEMTTINTPGGDGLDAFVCSITTTDSRGRPELPAVVNTGGTWRILKQEKNDPRPGLTVGHIVKLILDENAAWDGGNGTALLTRTFTAVNDSDSVAWPDNHERAWDVGTTLAQVLADLADIVDFDVSTSFDFSARPQRGGTVSAPLLKGSPSRASGENVAEYESSAEQPTATRAIVLTNDRFLYRNNATQEGARQARAVYLESSQSGSLGEGRRMATRYFAENGVLRRVYTARAIATTGKVPMVHLSWGDTIGGLNRDGGTLAGLQILNITLDAPGDEAPVTFLLELEE